MLSIQLFSNLDFVLNHINILKQLTLHPNTAFALISLRVLVQLDMALRKPIIFSLFSISQKLQKPRNQKPLKA